MNIKRITGKTEYEAMQRAREEYGNSAYILHTKQIKQTGFFKWFKKPLYEVIIGIETDREIKEKEKKERQYELIKESQENTQKELDELKHAIDGMKNLFREELDKKSDEIQKLYDKREEEQREKNEDIIFDQIKFDGIGSGDSSPQITKVKEVEKTDIKDDLDELDMIAKLRNVKCTEDVIDKIKEMVRSDEELEEGASDVDKNRAVKAAIRKFAGEPYAIEKKKKGPRILFFVGPTGVGKTTTIAKIAAKLSLLNDFKIAMITTDTFRIAAVDQLKAYANILSVPISVVYKGDEIEETLEEYKTYDFILVDTAGRNHREKDFKKYIQSFLDNMRDPVVFLLLNLGLSIDDLKLITDSYSFIDDYNLIYTKLDETTSSGNILNIMDITGKKAAFITNGQSVPKDIMTASKGNVLSALTGDYDE